MTDFEKEIYEGLKEKEVCDYTYIDTISILSKIKRNAKNNVNTNRGRNEAREFETIIEEAANSIEHKYSELLECVEKIEFICRVGDLYSEYAYEKSKMTQKKIEELHPEATKNRLGRLVDKDGKTVHIDITELRVTEEEMGKIALDKVVDEFFEELKMELVK